jgi:hypothetical protein
MQLHVIARTCSNSLLTPKTHKRICGDDRDVLIKKCFISLANTIRASQHDIKLTVLDDHSDSQFLEFIKNEAENINLSLISLEKRGPNNSALEQFKVAAESDGLVYIVEDDYLHEENAIDYMLGAYIHFMHKFNSDTIIFPYDCSLRYQDGHESLTTIYHDGVRYWRSVDKTSNTMFTHYSVLKRNWDKFENLAKNYPKVLEDDTINTLYYSHINPNASIRVFSPIPSIAYHVGYSITTQIATSHMSWQDLWNRIPNWSLIPGWFYNPKFYEQIVYMLPSNAKIVEVGTWKGRSTCCMAELIKTSGKNIKFYAVDTFEGSNESIHKTLITELKTDLYSEFIKNLKFCEVDNIVVPMRMTSKEASKSFEDESLDFVMLDGAHDYDSVLADIQSWLPKVKKGGMLAGDDYGGDWLGVTKAVNESFGDKIKVINGIWYIIKK